MRDNLRRSHAIRHARGQGSPTSSQGHFARQLNTLAALIRGLVGGKSPPLPHSATQVPDGTKPESRVTRLTRGLDNARLVDEVDFVPSAALLLPH